MTLPNYFLADLPAEAILTPRLIGEACQSIRKNRERYILDLQQERIVRCLARAAKNWLDHDHPIRRLALEPGQTRYSTETLSAGIDQFFSRVTEESLFNLLTQEFGDERRMDSPVSTPEENVDRRSAMVTGPSLIGHIAAGNLPCPTWSAMIHGLLVRSAQFVKCASGHSFLPRLFAHSIYELEPKLGACIEVAEWAGGSEPLESALFHEADFVTATGSDTTLEQIRSRLPAGKRFLGFGHRVSFGYITQDFLSRAQARLIARQAAVDVVAWDQSGCLSPHAYYVEQGAAVTPEMFAAMLSEELAQLSAQQPHGQLSLSESARVAAARGFFEVRAANSSGTKLWASEGSTAWTVVFDDDTVFQHSCLNRFILVKSAQDIESTLRAAEMVRGKVSTVAIAASIVATTPIAQRLARWGVTRICPIGQMQNPPIAWRHDGRPVLADYVTWTDVEQ
ncbi:MAG: hypothetical protein EXS24_05685 [Pedosphaera sp.]|nr:hypothetical protein [Pedosphaera sp.]